MANTDTQKLFVSEINVEKKGASLKVEDWTSLLLYNLDLKEDEIRRLEIEFNDLLSFRSVTEEDLKDLGIKDANTREALLEYLKNCPQYRRKLKVQKLQPLSVEEALRSLKQDKLHLEVLQSLLLCLKKTRTEAKFIEGGLLDSDWSIEEAIKALTKVSIREAEQLCDRIQGLQESLKEGKFKESSDEKKRSSKRYIGWALGCILTATTGVFIWRRFHTKLT